MSATANRPLLGLWARHPITPFVLSQLSTARMIMANDLLEFSLKDQYREQGLLTTDLLEELLAAGHAALSRAGTSYDELHELTDEDADASTDDGPPGTIYLDDATQVLPDEPDDDIDPDDEIEYATPDGRPLPAPLDTEPVAAEDPTNPPLAWQWPLTLADVLTVVTACDFLAKSQLGAFGDEMRYIQVDLQHNVTAEEFDARQHEMLDYLTRFQREWYELFGHLPAYQQRLARLAALVEEE